MNKVLILATAVVGILGCGGKGGLKNESPPPAWMKGEPAVENMICAVGTSGPTYYWEDAKKYAGENARAELARILSVHIESIMVDITSDKGSSVDEATVMQATSWATSTVLENSQIIDYWFDSQGEVSQSKKITYALCCMPRKLDRERLTQRLENSQTFKSVKPEDISRTAAEIIKRLGEGRKKE